MCIFVRIYNSMNANTHPSNVLGIPRFEHKNQRNSLGKKGSKDFTAFDLQKPVKNRNTTNVACISAVT